MSRLRSLSRMQILALALAGALLAGVLVSAIVDAPRIALALIGILATGAFLGSIQARRRAGEATDRVGGGVIQLRREIRKLEKYLASTQEVTGDFATRRLLAVIESERLAAAERQAELDSRLRALDSDLRDLRKAVVRLSEQDGGG